MKKIAKFEKVSLGQFTKDYLKIYPDTSLLVIEKIYEEIKLPARATTGSAGYDFFMPNSINLKSQSSCLIPTGIRVKISDGWVLKIYPRSGLGFKYRLQLDNTVGIIDSDYYNSSNEGHIMIKLTCDSLDNKEVSLEKKMAIVQGIFLEYGICEDDFVTNQRDGGFGSTSKQLEK